VHQFDEYVAARSGRALVVGECDEDLAVGEAAGEEVADSYG
jgi:hypothetical protein